MPGSKRRALKKLLSPHSTPSGTPQSTSSTPALTPQESNISEISNTSIASNPANYLSDEALEQDLAIEEMIAREKTIGSGTHLTDDGVSLDSNLSGGRGTSIPPPNPSSQLPPGQGDTSPMGSMGGGTGVGNGLNGHRSPPPPPSKSPLGMGGGMYPQQVTAEQLMFGDDFANGGAGRKGKKKSSKQRFAERQSRRQEALLHSAPPDDPSWNAQLERERQEEIQVIGDACEKLGRAIHEIPPDGHCMFNAITDQLIQIGLLPEHQSSDPSFARKKASEWMLSHPDDFMPFLPSITGEDSAGATDDGLITPEGFKKYCRLVAETGEWGGEPEIQALSRAFGVPIHVIQRGPPTVVSHGGMDDTFGGGLTAEKSAALGDKVVRISYHKRMYGLGEHYNSLRKVL